MAGASVIWWQCAGSVARYRDLSPSFRLSALISDKWNVCLNEFKMKKYFLSASPTTRFAKMKTNGFSWYEAFKPWLQQTIPKALKAPMVNWLILKFIITPIYPLHLNSIYRYIYQDSSVVLVCYYWASWRKLSEQNQVVAAPVSWGRGCGRGSRYQVRVGGWDAAHCR